MYFSVILHHYQTLPTRSDAYETCFSLLSSSSPPPPKKKRRLVTHLSLSKQMRMRISYRAWKKTANHKSTRMCRGITASLIISCSVLFGACLGISQILFLFTFRHIRARWRNMANLAQCGAAGFSTQSLGKANKSQINIECILHINITVNVYVGQYQNSDIW